VTEAAVAQESRWLSAAARAGAAVFLGVVPVCLVAFLLAANGHHPTDFRTFWDSSRAILHGRSPYPTLASLPAHADRTTFAPFVYPPLAAVPMLPLALLPFGVAVVGFILVDLAAVVLALRLLGVRDLRCHGAALASAPVFAATGIGAISPLLLLGLAAAWRYRDRALAAGALVAYVVTAKVFLWPVWLWLVRTRRFRAAVIGAVAALAGTMATWAAIGFGGLREYPALLARLTGLVGPESYSPYALGRSVGLGGGAAQAGTYVLAAVVAAAALLRFRDDARLLIAAIAVALVATPILWPHYLVLLFVPIALARRSFSPLWLAPAATWADAEGWSSGSALRIAGLIAIASATVAMTLRASRTGHVAVGELRM
jgi:hypothetical protein